MNCTCLKDKTERILVADPQCPWHGDIEFPRSSFAVNALYYEVDWPVHFNCRCVAPENLPTWPVLPPEGI